MKPAGSKVNSDSIKAMKDSLAQFSANYCRGGKPNHLGNNFLCESFSSSVAPFLWQKNVKVQDKIENTHLSIVQTKEKYTKI